MSYVNVRDFRINATDVLKKLQEAREPQIVLRRGRPVAVLLPADDDASEAVALYKRARAQLAVRAIREDAQRRSLDQLTADQIDAIIGRSRAATKRSGDKRKTRAKPSGGRDRG